MADDLMDPRTTLDKMLTWLNGSDTTQRISELQEAFHVPGLAVAIVSARQIQSRAFGYATLEPKVPCTLDTLFDAASTSKALTATAAAMLVERNEHISWDTPMSMLLPEDFVMATLEATHQVTLEDILSHQSGLPGHDDSVLGVRAKQPDTPHSITRNLRNLPLSKPVGAQYQYSNIMYAVATYLVEAQSHSTFAAFLKTKIFDPLDMTSTFLQPSAVKAVQKCHLLSTPYYWKNGCYHIAPHQECPELQGAGSIFTTANDFIKFLCAMLYRSGPISEAIYKAVTRPRIMRNPKYSLESFRSNSSESAYALGWDLKYIRGAQVIAHDGIITGYGSRMFLLPEHDFAAYIIGNSDSAFNLSAVLQADMIDEVLDVAIADRFDRAKPLLKKQTAQMQRREKIARRNAERRAQARDGLELPPSAYVGTFYNDAYKCIIISEFEQTLVVDGSDRSTPFEILLEHVKDGTEFRGYVVADDSGGEDMLPVRFRVEGGEAVQAVGIGFEEALGPDHFFWFERV